MILIPMVLAVLVDRVSRPRLASAYRLILLIPSMIPSPLIFVLWIWMYNQQIGPINYILTTIGIIDNPRDVLWLSDSLLQFPAIAVMEWWWGLGYHTMFFLAGLATIPKDIFDAARVDGASEWRIFRGITMFRLLPIILVLAVVRFGSAMAVVDEYVISGALGDTTNSTYTWTVYMLDEGFVGSPAYRGYAAAIGWVGAFFMLLVVGFFFWLFRSRD
jgi:multiple sugar transport system permease protein